MTSIIIIIFIIGYAAIAFEHPIKINKAASALVTGVLCWTVFITFSSDYHIISEQLAEHLGDLSGILFFLLGAMTIVELIDAHQGFEIITEKISQKRVRPLMWIVAGITFFLSAILDNLTTTIVMVSLLRKLIHDDKKRLLFAGMVVVAANAGGAWSPIGDVSTTMLWIGGQITAYNIIAKLILPSIICLIVPLLIVSIGLKGKVERPLVIVSENENTLSNKHKNTVLISGIVILILVPVFKTLTNLPPYMGMLLGLGLLWIITEIMHSKRDEVDRHPLSVANALRRIDTPSILFFLGILLSVAALSSTGVLSTLAVWMSQVLPNQNAVILSLGILSSIVDNVPLVAATQGMYDLSVYPTDHYFWEFLAYATGTGGSMLIIGSAAGVAAMGLEKIRFFWYLKKISLLALAGYFSGALVYIFQDWLLN